MNSIVQVLPSPLFYGNYCLLRIRCGDDRFICEDVEDIVRELLLAVILNLGSVIISYFLAKFVQFGRSFANVLHILPDNNFP